MDPRAFLGFEKRKKSRASAGNGPPGHPCHYTLLQNRVYELCGGCTLNRKVEAHIPASVFKYGRKRPFFEVDYRFYPIESFLNVKVKFLS